jgi:hypothetical protein
MHRLSSDQLNRVRVERRELEVYAATQVGRYLIATQRGYIRRLILAMIDKMLALGDREPVLLDHFLVRQTSFAMWKQCHTVPSPRGLSRVRAQVAAGGLESYVWLHVCADIIRLFGELAEQKWTSDAPDLNWHIMARKGQLRPGPVYAKPEESPDHFGARHRLNKAPAEKVRVDAPFVPIPRERVEWRGVELFKFGEDSVIATVDWAYGLQIEGGDVSGTTTDSIAALRWASRQENLVNPIVQLIALATMVPQGHHTIVECSWPLTRHGYMDYAIGFYGTLAPADHAGLQGTLKIFDNDARNRHVLACVATAKSDWKTWPQRGGRIIAPVKELALHFDRADEIDVYRHLAEIRRAYGFCAGGRPTLDSVTHFVETADTGSRGKQIIDRMFSQYHLAS